MCDALKVFFIAYEGSNDYVETDKLMLGHKIQGVHTVTVRKGYGYYNEAEEFLCDQVLKELRQLFEKWLKSILLFAWVTISLKELYQRFCFKSGITSYLQYHSVK